jgi:hypothetical protein
MFECNFDDSYHNIYPWHFIQRYVFFYKKVHKSKNKSHQRHNLSLPVTFILEIRVLSVEMLPA